MSRVQSLVHFLDSISEWTGKISFWSIVPLVLLVCYEVISRKIFNSPHVWALELPVMICAFFWAMTTARTLYHKRHVRIDILTQRLSPRAQIILDSLLYLGLFFPFVVVVLVVGIDFTVTAWSTSEQTPFAWRVPTYPFKTLVPLMALLLIIQGISDFTKNVFYIVKGVRL